MGSGHVQEDTILSWCNSKVQTQDRQRTRQKDIEEEEEEDSAAAEGKEEKKGVRNWEEEGWSRKAACCLSVTCAQLRHPASTCT